MKKIFLLITILGVIFIACGCKISESEKEYNIAHEKVAKVCIAQKGISIFYGWNNLKVKNCIIPKQE